jgi:hypothetical protein
MVYYFTKCTYVIFYLGKINVKLVDLVGTHGSFGEIGTFSKSSAACFLEHFWCLEFI